MTMRASLLLAFRFLFGRGTEKRGRIRSAVIGIGISLVPLVVVLEVADGMIQGITSRFIEAGTYHLQAYSTGSASLDQLDSAATRLEAVGGVEVAIPERRGMGLIYSDDGRSAATIRAVPERLWSDDAGFRNFVDVKAGSFDLTSPQSIVLGSHIASQLKVGPGDKVKLLTVRSLSGASFLPRVSTFTVVGVASTGYQELDRLWVFIPLARGMRILPPESSRQLIGIKVKRPFELTNPLFSSSDPEATYNLVGEIYDVLGAGWKVFTWYDLERSRYMSFRTTKSLLVFIMVLIVAVAAVNISSTLVMLILEKQSEIAILKSVGASPAGISRTFLTCGFLAGSFGTFVGLAVGLAVAVNINEILMFTENVLNALFAALSFLGAPFGASALPPVNIFNADFYLARIPIRIRLPELTLAGMLSVALSTLAAYLPAHKAGLTRPLDVMRRH